MSDIKLKKLEDIDSSGNHDNNFYKTLLTTFTAVFIAELGDKTQVATLLLSAESGKPFIVFLAAATALILTSLLGVLLGQFLSSLIHPSIFRKASAYLMIIISILIFMNLYLFDNSLL